MADTINAIYLQTAAAAEFGVAGSMAGGQFIASASNPWAGVTSAAAGNSLAHSVLEGSASGFSALAALGRGAAERDLRLSDADDLDRRASEEMLISETEAARAKKALLKTIGKQQTGYAASGVDLSQGTVATAAREASDDAEGELSVSRTLSQSRVARFRRQATAKRAEALYAESASYLTAAGKAADFGVSLYKRG